MGHGICGPPAYGSAWVYVNSGCVGLGTGNGGSTGIDVSTCALGKWIFLQVQNGSSPANEFIVYASFGSSSGADYYVDNAAVTLAPVPEPSTLALIAPAALGLGHLLRRKRLAKPKSTFPYRPTARAAR